MYYLIYAITFPCDLLNFSSKGFKFTALTKFPLVQDLTYISSTYIPMNYSFF